MGANGKKRSYENVEPPTEICFEALSDRLKESYFQYGLQRSELHSFGTTVFIDNFILSLK